MDTLNYFISNYARRHLSDSLQITNYVFGTNSIYAKAPSQYEWHTWDNNFIYLRQDTSINTVIDGKVSRCYRLDNGIWMKRQMSVGDYFEVVPRVHWLDRECGIIRTWETWKYYMYLEWAGERNMGGDIGKEKVIVLKFDYYSAFEKFIYSRRYGWVGWEHWEDNKQIKEVLFNQFKPPILYTPTCGSPKITLSYNAVKRTGMPSIKRHLIQTRK